MRGNFEVKRLVCGLFGLGLGLSACSGGARDCNETLTCPGPIGYIDAGNFDNWWSAGAAGESATGDEPRQTDTEAGPGEAGGEGGAMGSATGEPPRVLSVSPSDGALGVESNAEIVITFSEPMATSSIEAAYQSPDLPVSRLTFTWNEAGTELTIKPTAPLVYQAGTAQSDGALDFLPKTYHYGFAELTSRAASSSSSGDSFSFSTLRQVSADLPADPSRTGNWTAGEGEGIHNCLRDAKSPYVPTVCIGDDSNNVRYVGFLSFDLSGLPAAIASFSNASLTAVGLTYGSPSELGPSLFEHVEFGVLDASGLSAPALANLGAFYGATALSSGSHLALLKDVTSAVSQDYADRQSDGRVTQYRLSFADIEPDGIWDDVEFVTSSIRLSVAYLLP
jgi:hypothetical protein